MLNRIVAVITAVTGDRVRVSSQELLHAQKHFTLPQDILLELLERVLKDPSALFVDDLKAPTEYDLFYRLEDGRYILAVVKKIAKGCFFSTMYSTGHSIRPKHRKMKRIKI
jgi:hypothetical protein